MTPADMAALHAAAFANARSWSAAEFSALLAQPGSFVAGDRTCFAFGRVTLDEAELLTIATDPGHRRAGLARACMARWQAEARLRGAARAFLEVAADNAAAIGLYTACGFTPCGRRPGYYRRPGQALVDAVVMARALT